MDDVVVSVRVAVVEVAALSVVQEIPGAFGTCDVNGHVPLPRWKQHHAFAQDSEFRFNPCKAVETERRLFVGGPRRLPGTKAMVAVVQLCRSLEASHIWARSARESEVEGCREAN